MTVSGGVWGLTAKKHERTFQNDRNGPYLDKGMDCMGLCIHQNSLTCTFKMYTCHSVYILPKKTPKTIKKHLASRFTSNSGTG